MKKLGILIFISALVVGIAAGTIFSFGKADRPFFSFSFGNKTKGSGNIVSEARDVRGFSGVDVGGVFEVEITAQKEFVVEVEADDNLLPLIRTEVRNGILHIETEKSISSQNGLKVRISAPDIDRVDVSGAARVNIENVRNELLNIDASGASKLNVSGETQKLVVEVSGASSVNADDLRSAAADVDASGASYASVFTSGELRADASGASKVVYSGTPANISRSTSGASKVRAK